MVSASYNWKRQIEVTTPSWRSRFYTAAKQLYSLQLYPKEDEVESSLAHWNQGD